jgi:alanyl-tRNA synthetase
MTDLLVTYPAGSTVERSTVAAVTYLDEEALFAVGRTPCHPESPRWPDQPADHCTLECNGTRTNVQAQEGYLLGGELGLGRPPEELSSAAEPDHSRQSLACVVHSVPAELAPAVGELVTLRVDERYREALSRSHSRCHLVSLALNAALREAWRKDPSAWDSLGNPDFDKLAIVSSKIEEGGSLDSYRVGKHVRKAGFSVEALSDPDALARDVRDLAETWLLSSPRVLVAPGECPLAERRTWSCELPEATASFPCGGTHPSRLEPDEGLAVRIAWDPQERRLQMRAASKTFHL